MELEAAKMIGAGLAAIALAGAGVGICIIFGNFKWGSFNLFNVLKCWPEYLLNHQSILIALIIDLLRDRLYLGTPRHTQK